jgi:hypothetical protein
VLIFLPALSNISKNIAESSEKFLLRNFYKLFYFIFAEMFHVDAGTNIFMCHILPMIGCSVADPGCLCVYVLGIE